PVRGPEAVIESAPVPEPLLLEPEPAQVFAEPAPAPSGAAPPSSTLPPPPPPPTGDAASTKESSGTVSSGTVSSGTVSQAAETPEREASSSLLSPVVRRLIADNGLDPSTIVGTGLGGRITRADVEAAIRLRAPSAPSTPSPQAAQESVLSPPFAERPSAPAAKTPPAQPAVPSAEVGTRDKVVALNNIRKRTAEHMVMSKSASPHVLTAMEIDYEGVEKVRKAIKSGWKAEEGFSLTYLPFIARAVVDALREYPHLNASFGGDHLVVHDEVNLAIAVDIDFNGLLAPVIKGAEGKRLRQVARDIVDVAARARTKQLMPDELSGGTFTLTNAGQYGTMMQFPIINQPQVAILSTDGVARKPVVVTDSFGNESIAVHSVGVLAMAWDHRAFDGAYAAAFLHRVKEIIETRDWEAEVR
ncbi:MAG: dihydrolipoamide acetyltransferase family protein, partial [Acidimicrobiaceae bacterium]|nr:dihydrolipoamide acetyltransferase family protein [Acidimicrobiaceae bacterium]